jgi:hypothetical protein
MDDFLSWIEDELATERDEAAAHIDRAEALAALRSRALPRAQALRRPLTPEDVLVSEDERERAELRALALRVTRGEPANEFPDRAGHHVESGAAF